MEKFKGVKRLKTLDDVRDAEEFAGILGDETILIDVDDGPTSDGTTRGKHFYFRNPEGAVEKSWTKQTLAIGIETDAKVGRNNSYAIMRFKGVDRPVLLDCPEDEIQVVPKWLIPIKTNMGNESWKRFFGMMLSKNRCFSKKKHFCLISSPFT